MSEGAHKSERHPFDLEERTGRFGEAVIRFAKQIPPSPVNSPLISQLVRAGTSVGANYVEADDASSKKDFRHKLSISKRESRECKHWLRMLVAAEPQFREDARQLWTEAKEIHLILSAILRKS